MNGVNGHTYFGKYRGTVLNNVDPLRLGRLLIQVDGLRLFPSNWAMPCVPFTGKQMGMWVLPPVGAGVWVEFEEGDPDYPIWSGCWWGSPDEPPALALSAPPSVSNVVIQTNGQHSFMLSDVPGASGGILLKTANGAFISINDEGIVLSNGQGATIVMNGPTISLNGEALTIT